MEIYHNISLKPYHTFGIEVSGRKMIWLREAGEIYPLLSTEIFKEEFLILGGGSNILFSGNFEGNIIQLRSKGIKVIEEDDDRVILRVASGETWEEFVGFALENHYYGIENLVGIPGWVGSSPVQNIGAYGVEAKDVITEVEAISLKTGETIIFDNKACEFDYRSSVFKNKLRREVLITHIHFTLSKKENYKLHYAGLQDILAARKIPLNLRNVAQTIIELRNQKLPDPQRIGSAGSFFKNPVISMSAGKELMELYPGLIYYPFGKDRIKLAAGQLIDICGWKGYREGDVGVYPNQALVIVNYGNATGKEIVDFSQRIQRSVKEKFGVDIIPEVNIV